MAEVASDFLSLDYSDYWPWGFLRGLDFVGFELLHIIKRVSSGVFLSDSSDVVCPDMGQVEKRQE